MKGKIKHGFLAIALCIAMLVTSVNLTNLFDNRLNAGTITGTASISISDSGINRTFTCNPSFENATNSTTYTYQWQVSTNGGSSYSNISGATGQSYTVSMANKNANYRYRCYVEATRYNAYSLMDDLYQAFLNRNCDASGFNTWYTTNIQNHNLINVANGWANQVSKSIDTESEALAVCAILGTSEYTDINGNDYRRQSIIDCYEFFLQRTPSESEINSWMSCYNNNTTISYATISGKSVAIRAGLFDVIHGIGHSTEATTKMTTRYNFNGTQFTYTSNDGYSYTDTGSCYSDSGSIPVYNQSVYVRYQNADGTWGNYNEVINGSYSYGTTISWSRAQDTIYNAASISYQVTQSNTKYVDVSRRTYPAIIRIQNQDQYGNYGSSWVWINTTLRYGQTYSWQAYETTDACWNYQVVSGTCTGSIDKTIQISRKLYYLDLNGYLDGTINGGLGSYGTADIYINGSLISNDVTDHYQQARYGSSYEIKDIKATTGHTYNGVQSGSLSGTLTGSTSTALNFTTNSYTVTYIDRIKGTTTNLGSSTANKTYGTSVAGSDIGTSTTVGVYYTGYKYDSCTSATVGTSGATVYRYFTAASYTLTVNPNGGTWNSSTSNSTFTMNYGTTKTIANPTRTGYTFSKWNVSGTGSSISGTTFTMGYANTTLTAQWTPRTDTKYIVNHYQMNTDGSTYTLKDTENLTGTTATSVTPSVKTYTGFTSPSTQTVTIAADGTTVVNYYYTRNKYTVTYIDVIDSTNGTQLGKSTDSLYYGATATGATKGTNATDNYYYNGYYYSSCTTATVGTSGATVYRIFKLRTVDVSGSVNWNDKSNAYSSRPNNVTIYLYRNGQQIDTYTGLTDSDNNSFSFTNLQKYDTSTGVAYTYTVSQSNVESNNNPEDQYTTTVDTTGFNFTNTLGNTKQDNPDPAWVGFEVNGSILWEDYDDKLGTRPSEITLTLYQNDVAIKTQVVDKTATGYSFVNLDKYDDDLNPYTYKVEETFTARALTWDSTTKQYEEIDAYTITVDGFDFTNTLVDTKDKPIIEVKPDHNNTLTIKLGFDSNIDWSEIEKSSSDVQAFVTLKQMETLMNNGTISYTSNYNGMEYNAIVTKTGVSINNIPSGKYEIVESNDNTFILEGIDLQTTSSISVVNENDKWYLIIAETNKNQTGTITLNMNTDSFNGIDSSMIVDNLYSLTQTSPMQVMMLSMFSDEITVPEYVEPTTYTITYKDCDVVDDTKYSENSEATLKDCDIENFLGWSEDSEATEPQYLAGDTITMEKDIVLHPVIESLESTEEGTSEETESEEQEEIPETENTSEEETSESEESTEDVETATEEESSEAEETETESSETEEPLEKNSAFSE